MIIFDLDGVLADCEHRLHLVDPKKNTEFISMHYRQFGYINPRTHEIFKPDWDAFHELCDKDKPIQTVIDIITSIGIPYEIWSGRSESVRNKTEAWLCRFIHISEMPVLRMRPIEEYAPVEKLKEWWLDESILKFGKTIDYVFDSHPESIRMWRQRGIFVFDCNQYYK